MLKLGFALERLNYSVPVFLNNNTTGPLGRCRTALPASGGDHAATGADGPIQAQRPAPLAHQRRGLAAAGAEGTVPQPKGDPSRESLENTVVDAMNESGIRVSRVPRCQVPALPELTEVGGRRCHSNDLAERDGLFPQLGSGVFVLLVGS